jgi:hypothetical protein
MTAATTAGANIDDSTWMQDHPWVGIVLGIIVSGLVHGGKMAARPAINAGTLGAGAPIVSTVEDGTSVGLSLVAVFLPVLVIVALVVLVVLFAWVLRVALRWRRRRRQREPRVPAY